MGELSESKRVETGRMSWKGAGMKVGEFCERGFRGLAE